MSPDPRTGLSTELCVECGYDFDAAASIDGDDDARPRPGDLSVCLNCGHPSVFAGDLKKRELTREELANLSAESRRIIAFARTHCMRARGEDASKRGPRA